MTGTTIATLPVIILFLSLQKYYVQGIKLSGVKA
jgi:multiple sugar transport system permease protein